MMKSTLLAALAVLLAGSLALAQSVQVKKGCGGCSGDGSCAVGMELVHTGDKVRLTVPGGWKSLPDPARKAILGQLSKIMCEKKLKAFLGQLEAGAETAEIDVCGRTDHDVVPGGCGEDDDGGCGEGGAEGGCGGGCGGSAGGGDRVIRIRKVGEGEAVGDPSDRLFIGAPGGDGELGELIEELKDLRVKVGEVRLEAGEPRRMVLQRKEALPGQVEVEVEEWSSEPEEFRVFVAGDEGWDQLPPEVRKEMLEHLRSSLPPEEMKRVLEALRTGEGPRRFLAVTPRAPFSGGVFLPGAPGRGPWGPDCGGRCGGRKAGPCGGDCGGRQQGRCGGDCGGRGGDPVVRALEELTREVRALREEIRRAHGGPAPAPRDERDRELMELRMQLGKLREHLDMMGQRLRELMDR